MKFEENEENIQLKENKKIDLTTSKREREKNLVETKRKKKKNRYRKKITMNKTKLQFKFCLSNDLIIDIVFFQTEGREGKIWILNGFLF